MWANGAVRTSSKRVCRGLMEDFTYRENRLYAEQVPLADIAKAYGTPCFVYSSSAIVRHVRELQEALEGQAHRICYAVKANSNLSILKRLAALGCAFDIVSGGELARVQAAGGDVSASVFSGVGKSEAEIRQALAAGIGAFHVESESELQRIDRIAGEEGVIAPISLRINPSVNVDTHPHIATGFRGSKFGIPMEDALNMYCWAAERPQLKLKGMACHVGSQLVDAQPIVEAVQQLVQLADELNEKGIVLEYIDAGGGLGICYNDEHPPQARAYVEGLQQVLAGRDLTLVIEPGRFVVGNAGILLTRVEYIKQTSGGCFVVVDGAMTELMRPALYGAWHAIMAERRLKDQEPMVCDVVGPVCETSDCLGRSRRLVTAEGELLAVFSAGAYAASMGSFYNARPAAPEVLVEGERALLIRERGEVEQLYAGERLL